MIQFCLDLKRMMMMTTKHWLISSLLYLAVTQCSVAANGRYNITSEQLDTCDFYEIFSSSGYGFNAFFTTLDNNNKTANETLHLKLYVLTSMDAHILLSVTSRPRVYDRVYEIVLGAGGNTFSAIRTSMGQRPVSTNQHPQLLSISEPTPIEIIQTKEGDLFVYIPGFRKEPLLHFMDTSALNINYVSFSSFGANSARWFFNCDFDGFVDEMGLEQPLQSVEKQ